MPPYSPDLNPIKQVWRKTRRETTHNRYFPRLSDIISTQGEYFASFFLPNDELRSLCSFDYFV
ncbi:MAG: transposase [Lachnospiraceae bacterium]|nr:transposase [Lachnospiraceae bacterium]MBP3297999.1 transposase [Lachnospiraceae bacterium]